MIFKSAIIEETVEEYIEIIDLNEDGSVMNKRVYSREEIPYNIMERYPMLYTPEEINAQKAAQIELNETPKE
jgi:hypothetical protein